MKFPMLRSIAIGLALGGAIGLLGTAAQAAVPTGSAAFARLPFSTLEGSVKPTTDAAIGVLANPRMTVEVVLAPRNAAQLSQMLVDVSNPSGRSYHQWLKKGQFNALFAPSGAKRIAVARYLQASGLTVESSLSPFYVRASGPSRAVEAAFRTSLRTYRSARGLTYFANASAAQLPSALADGVFGVIGLTSTVREQPHYRRGLTRPAAVSASAADCVFPYPTAAQLYAAVNLGILFPYGYGGGPLCSGLTPVQDNAIYGAPPVHIATKGTGVNLAVFELSGYLHADVATWTKQFYGAKFRAPLVDKNVDGGPLSLACPSNDTCYPGYSGDVEVDADIETQLAIAPAVSHLLVYNAPNDFTGVTSLDEYTTIAADDEADVISSSWGVCENDVSPAYVQAENVVFEQMALQGQSIFNSAGDTGAFGCIRSDGTNVVGQGDPAAQPWVTSVGGTSLESYNPGTYNYPHYPAGIESVWNVADLCNSSTDEGGHSGYFWCGATGAGGGGNSEYWARPFFQFGPGIDNAYTQRCALASTPSPCREVPDISANADEYTSYAEYCAGDPTTDSACASPAFGGGGWFGIGGTSLSTPLWSGIIADRDSFQRTRAGNASVLLYMLYNFDAAGYFNDITGAHQTTNNNGLYPVARGYDLATGIGTPKMAPIITGFPAK